jgi:hypothetical protein
MARRGQHGNSAAESGRRNAPNINSGVSSHIRQAIINWLHDPWKSQISSRIRGCDGMEFAEDESMYQAIPLLVVAVIVSHDWKCCCCCCRSGSTPDLLAKLLLGGLARPQPHFNNCAAATPREKPLQPTNTFTSCRCCAIHGMMFRRDMFPPFDRQYFNTGSGRVK